ncbi:uncharacterized protein LOC136000859 [Caloenas nicobarica]|uniref:uncharacterized protein LOC136000859 n=1 Tax=Caloenas nicobarica TaxID=187106 RepID=UPI0032B790CB
MALPPPSCFQSPLDFCPDCGSVLPPPAPPAPSAAPAATSPSRSPISRGKPSAAPSSSTGPPPTGGAGGGPILRPTSMGRW